MFIARHRIQQGTNRLATETTICYKRLLNLSGRSDSESVSLIHSDINSNSKRPMFEIIQINVFFYIQYNILRQIWFNCISETPKASTAKIKR